MPDLLQIWFTSLGPVRTLCLTLLIVAAIPVSASDESRAIDEIEFASRLTELEQAAAETDADVSDLVRTFARETVHSRVDVHSARVIATYERPGWKTRPYFAVNYDQNTYCYLDHIDEEFQDELKDNLHWVSVVKSLPDRQLMFELAVDEETFDQLESGEIVSFSCEIAGVIRGGKSVYSRLLSFEKVSGSQD